MPWRIGSPRCEALAGCCSRCSSWCAFLPAATRPSQILDKARRRASQVAPLYLRAKLDPLLSADALADERDGEGRGGGGDGGDAGGGPSGGGAGRRRRALSLAYRAVCAGLDVLHLWRASARRPPLSRRTRLAAWRREVLSGLLLPRRRQLLLFLSRRSPHASLAERLLRYRLLPAAAPAAADGGGGCGGGGAFRGSRREIGARLLELPLQHARQLLLLSAFGYRLLGWLHQPDDAPPLAAPLLPPPPPPPPLAPGKRPPLPGACGECAMSPMEQPTAAPSGYVFCAKCITRAVRRHGRCPLTHAPATLPSLVRLYETSRAPPAPPAEEPPALSSA